MITLIFIYLNNFDDLIPKLKIMKIKYIHLYLYQFFLLNLKLNYKINLILKI